VGDAGMEVGRPVQDDAPELEVGYLPDDDLPVRDARPADGDASARIGRLADDLLPALIARLDASGLGEIEVRTDAWRIRLRRPYDRRRVVTLPEGRRRRPDAASAVEQAAADGSLPPPGAHPASAGEVRSRLEDTPGPGAADVADPPGPTVATSPAVGYFTPREGWTGGRRVRSGDVLGFVDCLGVRQEVLAPADGFVGRLLAQAGEAVEYGQPLIHVDLPAPVVAAPEGAVEAAPGAAPEMAPVVAAPGAAPEPAREAVPEPAPETAPEAAPGVARTAPEAPPEAS
jgi:biotin carboxyl carrier protein